MFFSIASLVRPKPAEPVSPEHKIAESAASNRRVRLPAPDRQNITVLSRRLPNSPILPWNHYDSPWLDDEPVQAEN
jgi:hypothetical protein